MHQDTELILCPVNLRHVKLEQRAYNEAIAMAKRRNAKLLVATIAPEIEQNMNVLDSNKYWGKQLEKFVNDNPADGVAFEIVVRKGAVHRQILKLAEERQVDLIVMDSANPKIQDYLLGTIASHVVTHARCSVYIVRG